MVADLHLHTRHSDGTYTPSELVEAATGHGLSAIALTDHDTIEGCAEVAGLAERAGIGFLTGTEITAELKGRELHILGYLVDTGHDGLRTALGEAQKVRQDRVREMVARLNALGIPLMEERVFELAACRAPGRPHVARALVAGGHCTSLDEAFDRYLKKNRPGWVPKWKMSAERAVALIHEAGGIAVMAHPGLNHDDRMIDRLVRLGVDGLECHHPKHGPAAVEKYLGLARGYGLLVTGGSDCHGRSKNRPTMGTVRLGWEHVEALRARHGSGVRGAVGEG
ncbi:MAG: PHP domain-containing protein [Verrucomicrobiae bacterium]|nr:PHP domain-containing protein [Verrucomicrobiae bacterium]